MYLSYSEKNAKNLDSNNKITFNYKVTERLDFEF